MGWGEKQGDMGIGVLTTSQRFTAKAEVERAVNTLVGAVENVLREPSKTSLEVLEYHLQSYKEAKKRLL